MSSSCRHHAPAGVCSCFMSCMWRHACQSCMLWRGRSHCKGVAPHAEHTLAPAVSSSCTTSTKPLAAALCSAVQPFSSRAFRKNLLPSVPSTAFNACASPASHITQYVQCKYEHRAQAYLQVQSLCAVSWMVLVNGRALNS